MSLIIIFTETLKKIGFKKLQREKFKNSYVNQNIKA